MAEELKIKIKSSEAASVEIVPTEDGIEISIVRKDRPEYKGTRGNLEILKSFCGERKTDKSIDQKELLKFYRFYEPRMEGWKNTVKPEVLWKKWMLKD